MYQQVPAPVEGNTPSIYDRKSLPSQEVEPRKAATAPYPVTNNQHKTTEGDPVVLALVKESKAIRQRGDIASAVSMLERGVRLRPRDPLLWNRLAKLRLEQGKVVLAENLARKSLALIRSGQNRSLQVDNWLILADSLTRQGKLKEADLARQKAKTYSAN